MPLGSNKISVNKNKFNAGSGTSNPVTMNITDAVSNPSSGVIDYQTVQFDITSNRANTTFYYALTGNIAGSDFTNTTISGNITTDSGGNASITKTLANAAISADKDFNLQVKRSATGDQFAISNTITLYSIEFANVTATGTSTVVNTGNILLDGTFVEYTSNGTFTVNDFADTQSNVFLNVIGFYDTNSYYYQNTIKLLAVGGGSGGSNYHFGGGFSIPDGIDGSGGGGGNVKLVDLSLSNLDVANTNVTIGAGSLAGIDDPAVPGPTYYSKLGGDTVAFETSSIETTAVGGTHNDSDTRFSASKVRGGASNQYGTSAHKQGGLATTALYNSTQYHLGGGGASAIEDGNDYFASGGIFRGGDGADGRGIQNQDAPYYDGTSPTSTIYYGAGGAGNAYGGSASDGSAGLGGAASGADATPNRGGGGGAGADGGSGYVAIRYPSGTDFRFLSNVNLA